MERNNLIITLITGGAVLIILALILKSTLIEIAQPTKDTISSTGTAESKIMPDEAAVYLTIETLKGTADESRNENTAISDRVMASLKILGLEDKNIETLNYNIYPEYDWSENKQRLKGYKTVNSLKAKTKDFSLLGKIIDAAVDAGVNRVDNIQFELSSELEATAKKDALERASRDAKEKAEATARGLDVKLGKIVSVSTQDYYYQPFPIFRGGMAAEAKEAIASTSISPQELETRATVSVVFELK